MLLALNRSLIDSWLQMSNFHVEYGFEIKDIKIVRKRKTAGIYQNNHLAQASGQQISCHNLKSKLHVS